MREILILLKSWSLYVHQSLWLLHNIWLTKVTFMKIKNPVLFCFCFWLEWGSMLLVCLNVFVFFIQHKITWKRWITHGGELYNIVNYTTQFTTWNLDSNNKASTQIQNCTYLVWKDLAIEEYSQRVAPKSRQRWRKMKANVSNVTIKRQENKMNR